MTSCLARIAVLILATGALVAPAEEGPPGRGALSLAEEITLPPTEGLPTGGGVHWAGPTQPLPEGIAGSWNWTSDGERVWRVGLRAPGARALRVRFESFTTPGRVWLYPADGEGPAAGPYTGGGPHRDGGFWSGIVPGEAVTVEYAPARDAGLTDAVPFRLTAVSRITDEGFPVARRPRKSTRSRPRAIAGCHLDATCFPAVEERDHPSVAMLLLTDERGSYTCSGFLINPQYRSEDQLLLLTAGHCIDTEERARDASFIWRYQTEECYGDPEWRLWEDQPVVSDGATLLVRADDRYHDFALLALDRHDVLDVTGVAKLGWDTSPVRPGLQVATISHPDGYHKRAAFGEVVDYRWAETSEVGFKTIRWRIGTMEPGSSGSPVLAIDGGDTYVIGIAVGGTEEREIEEHTLWGPYCDPSVRSVFNRFDQVYQTIAPYLEEEILIPSTAVQPRSAAVTLGTSGETITLVQDAAGAWWDDLEPVISGETRVTSTNGREYTLVLETDELGTVTWTAEYIRPRAVVRLGTTDHTIELTQADDGSWWLGDASVQVGSIVQGPDGKRYRLARLGRQWLSVEVTE